MTAILILLNHIVLPATFLVWLWRGRPTSRLQWAALALLVTAYLVYLFLTGFWIWVGYPLRLLTMALLVIVLIASYRVNRSLPWRAPVSWKGRLDLGLRVAMALIFSAGALYALTSLWADEDYVSLSFPMRDRVYVVGQGGANPLMNYHNVIATQRYAIDVVGLNSLGVRARGVYPSSPQRYAIFEDTVRSPCSGEVVRSVDGLKDYAPPERDRNRPAGNFVAIECQGVVVYLAHLRNGSVRVDAGEWVETGQRLGLVGNSGNTTEPHLHIHAEQGPYTGEGKAGVPIRFNGRFLVRNSVIW